MTPVCRSDIKAGTKSFKVTKKIFSKFKLIAVEIIQTFFRLLLVHEQTL
jgi:hypothetical protein